ncbi:lanthionine synthetase LanC family protein [Galbibacter pacificus]|uniref:Lanthionine synthetase C-like protein n=1 Tax=Galbibacter pacificus TaxID=2996052 RepID=A0ABT6FRW4_9FLAO|nr:lanthionine synthetase LanC family protein [Galbibacter pacificus]MDG3582875.1 hypothetical protein [Galbibacter pacificus]MDG3586006.1 hypothetical protein [Galbibacter pacificus]
MKTAIKSFIPHSISDGDTDFRLKKFIIARTKAINETYWKSDNPTAEWNQIGLMTGLAGSALVNFYVGNYLEKKAFIIEGDRMVTHIIKCLNSQTFSLSNIYSFCNGLSGVLFSLSHLQKKGFLSEKIHGLSEIEEFLFERGIKAISKNDIDYLHGGLGVLYYFLNQPNSSKNRQYIESMLEAYSSAALIDSSGLRIVNRSLLERESNEYDLGLAHGIIGHLMIFLEVYKKGIKTKKVKSLIESGLKYIENKVIDPGHQGYRAMYPVSFIENLPQNDMRNLEFYNSRLGWCYGDLNMAMLYIKLYKIFGKKEFLRKAEKIGEFSAMRINKGDTKITNVFFCHGSSGVAYTFLRLYQETSRQLFKDASDFWYHHMLGHTQKNINDFIKISATRCLLNGLGGPVLAALARTKPSGEDWNEIFLLN